MNDEIFYRDDTCVLDVTGITLLNYYFPSKRPKHIAYEDITDIKKFVMGSLTGKNRIWGTGDFRHWSPLDKHRPNKDIAIILDVGRHVRPKFSPQEAEQVLDILSEHTAGGPSPA